MTSVTTRPRNLNENTSAAAKSKHHSVHHESPAHIFAQRERLPAALGRRFRAPGQWPANVLQPPTAGAVPRLVPRT